MPKTVVFDFDGVIHSYTSGWMGPGVILDLPVPGIRESIAEIREAGYEVVVVSTRCAVLDGLRAVEGYLDRHGIIVDNILMEKPLALVYIDDRAICFDGHPETLLSKIEHFVPWNKKEENS
jgi:histidinol phosphatase-like enzyme